MPVFTTSQSDSSASLARVSPILAQGYQTRITWRPDVTLNLQQINHRAAWYYFIRHSEQIEMQPCMQRSRTQPASPPRDVLLRARILTAKRKKPPARMMTVLRWPTTLYVTLDSAPMTRNVDMDTSRPSTAEREIMVMDAQL